jgi:hypothetical protein
MDSEGLTLRTITLNFMDMMKQFLTALREVFPECPKVVAYDVAFTMKTAGKSLEQMEDLGVEAMEKYHEVMSPWYVRCTRRDETLLGERIEFLDELDLASKWGADMHPDTKDTIWEYINQLNNFCCLASWTRDIVPPNIMSTITSNATEMAEKIKSGEMTMSDFNIMDLSRKIMGSVDPEELEQLGQSLQAGRGFDIGSMYAMVSNMMPETECGGVSIGSMLNSMLSSSSVQN